MCKECFECYYGQCLDLKTNTIPCKLFNKTVLNKDAEKCDEFIPQILLDTEEDIEVSIEYNANHKCPFCGEEDTLLNVDAEGEEIIECLNCGKKYAISWCMY